MRKQLLKYLWICNEDGGLRKIDTHRIYCRQRAQVKAGGYLPDEPLWREPWSLTFPKGHGA